jgi:hypothetical protein
MGMTVGLLEVSISASIEAPHGSRRFACPGQIRMADSGHAWL